MRCLAAMSEAEMDRVASEESGSRFLAYVEGLVEAIGHADRVMPLRDYCLGLLTPGERKSVEPIAAVTAPARRSTSRSWTTPAPSTITRNTSPSPARSATATARALRW